jgi:hypothetical protein
MLGAGSAAAELSQQGDLFVRFDGGVSPRSLPRDSAAPISVRIEGTIRVLGHAHPPSLRRIRIALNKGGRLSSRGLPICRRRQIAAATSLEALALCGDALVGTGGLTAQTSFGEDPGFLARAEVLLFNARVDGHEAILAHIYEHDRARVTRVAVFEVHRSRGAFGTVLEAPVSAAINRHGYLKSINLRLQRSYLFRGRPRSYLSAACSAPPGIELVSFPFARVSMAFDDGRTLSSTLTRSCRVAHTHTTPSLLGHQSWAEA